MQTRFIIKTHTECLRPALFSLLILQCTSPTDTAYPEAVAKRLSNILQPEERKAAARFAVLIAEKHLKILRSNMTWDWRGSALHAVLRRSGKRADAQPSDLTQLSLLEKILFFKLFLEADGAMLAPLSELFLQHGEVPLELLYSEFEPIVERIYESYLVAAVDFRERMYVKRRRAEARRQIKGLSRQRSTLRHKILPHVQALVDLGLLEEAKPDVYKAVGEKQHSWIASFATYANRPDELDRLFDDGNPYEVAAVAYGLTAVPFSPDAHFEDTTSVLAAGYELMRDSTTGIAHIQAVADWCCSVLLAERNILLSPQQAQRDVIDELYRRDPSAVRFHIDFDGNRSYMILSMPER